MNKEETKNSVSLSPESDVQFSTIFRAAREVNKIIYTETNIHDLIVKVCGYLINHLNYFQVCVVYQDKAGDIVQYKWDELKGNILATKDKKSLPACVQQSLVDSKMIINDDHTIPCADCVLNIKGGREVVYVHPLHIEDYIDGAVMASLPVELHKNTIYSELFEELAKDIIQAISRFTLYENYKTTQESLRVSREKYQSILDITNDSVLIAQNGFIKYANRQLIEKSEYTEEELIGKPYFTFLTKETIRDIRKSIFRKKDTKSFLFKSEAVAVSKSGVNIEAEVSVVPIEYDQKPALQIVLKDMREQMIAQRALEASEEKFRFLSSSTFEGILVHKNGVAIDVNESFLQISGYTREEVIGENLLKYLYLEEDKEKIRKSFIYNKIEPFIVTAIRKGGSTFIAEIEVKEVVFKGEKIRIAALRDVTEKYKLQDQIKESERQLKTLLSNLPGLAYRCIDNHNWDMVFISDGCLQLTGYTPFQLVNSKEIAFNHVIYADDRPKVRRAVDSAKGNSNSFEVSYRIITREKEIKWVFEKGIIYKNEGVTYLEGFISDITSEIQAKLEFEKFKSISDSALYGSIITDYNGVVRYVNDYFAGIHGYSKEELLGKNITVFHTPSQMQFMKDVSKGDEAHDGFELKEVGHVHKDGREFLMLMSGIPITDNNTGSKYLAITAIDISKLKTVEKDLESNKLKIESIFRAAPTGIGVVVNRIIRHMNPRLAKMTGYSEKELIGVSSRILYLNQDEFDKVGLLKYKMIDVLGYGEIETQWRKKNGELIDILLSSTPIDLNDYSKGVTFTALDITERNLNDKSLRESEMQLQKSQEMAKIGSWGIDLNTMHAFGSKQAMHIYGVGKLKMLDANLIQQIHLPEYREHLDLALTNLIQGKDKYDEEFQLKNMRTNNIIDVHSVAEYDPETNIVSGIIQDISQQKKAEKESKKAYKLLQQTEQIGLSGSWFIDFRTGDQMWSEGEYHLHGFEPGSEVAQDRHLERVHPDDQASHNAQFYQNMDSDKFEFQQQYRMLYPDGTLRYIQADYVIDRDESGKPTFVVGTSRDISKMIETENQIISQNKELKLAIIKAEESDRLKSAFLANMSHEIRTPMNGILGFTSIIKDREISVEKQKQYLDIIQKSGYRMLNTINDLIDISRIEAGQVELNMSDVDVAEILQEMFDFFVVECDLKNIELFLSIPPNGAKHIIKSDVDKLSSVLTNLLKNAIKFTDIGSINFGYVELNSVLEFFVEDTGMGIPLDRQKAVFDRFVQADIADCNAMEGSGLGLSISKSYVEMMKGEMRLISDESVGSSFYFTLPLH